MLGFDLWVFQHPNQIENSKIAAEVSRDARQKTIIVALRQRRGPATLQRRGNTSEEADQKQGQRNKELIGKALAKVFGTSNERAIKRMRPLVEQMNDLEPEMKQLTDEQLRAKTNEFRARI